MLKVNLPAKYKPGEIKKHRMRRPCGKRKKRFIPVMTEKEFLLLSRPAEASEVEGMPRCEQVWHISLTPSTQEMPIKMRRQNSPARGTRGTLERVSPTGQMPPYGHLWARLLLLPPIPPQQTRIFKAFQASLREFNPFQACVMVTVFRIFFMIPFPSCNMRPCKKKQRLSMARTVDPRYSRHVNVRGAERKDSPDTQKRGIGAGKVNGPGGKFEPGETALQCVCGKFGKSFTLILRMPGKWAC